MNRPPQKNRPERNDPRAELGLRPIVNVAGTMTTLGASIAVPEAIEAMVRIMPEFVEIADLQQKASPVIARLTGADAGTVAACSSAGITMAIAACMTGKDMGKVEQLPCGNAPSVGNAPSGSNVPSDRNAPDSTGMSNPAGIPFDTSNPSAGGTGTEVLLQVGHMVSYGAPITQAVRLTGARVVPIGDVTGARDYQLRAALSSRTAAALYVVSHHVVDHGQIPLPDFAAICHERGVPVVVDAASEYDLRRFLEEGADLVIYSGHKFLGGPTSGIVAGRKDLVEAAYLQNFGICRGMKIGKEGIAGLIATLEAWERRDHAAIRANEASHLKLWQDRLVACPGVRTEIVPDPTDNPLDRLRLHIDPAAAGGAALDLARALAAGEPPIVVRGHLIGRGFFDLDPCNLHEGEAAIVAERLEEALAELRESAT